MGNTICTSYGFGPPTKVIYRYPHEHCVDCPSRKITHIHQYPRRMDYWPESPQWASVAKNLEEYLREQSKATKFRREKEKYRCKRPHFDQQPSGASPSILSLYGWDDFQADSGTQGLKEGHPPKGFIRHRSGLQCNLGGRTLDLH